MTPKQNLRTRTQLYGMARCAGPCAVFSAEVGTHSVDVFIKPAPPFVDQARSLRAARRTYVVAYSAHLLHT